MQMLRDRSYGPFWYYVTIEHGQVSLFDHERVSTGLLFRQLYRIHWDAREQLSIGLHHGYTYTTTPGKNTKVHLYKSFITYTLAVWVNMDRWWKYMYNVIHLHFI